MTRINCVPPSELVREHLLAEYRELPRVVALANSAWKRRAAFERFIPASYAMGPGHVRFFHNKLGWVRKRFAALVAEMRARGYKPSYDRLPEITVGPEWLGDWTPDDKALAINRARIAERLSTMKGNRA